MVKIVGRLNCVKIIEIVKRMWADLALILINTIAWWCLSHCKVWKINLTWASTVFISCNASSYLVGFVQEIAKWPVCEGYQWKISKSPWKWRKEEEEDKTAVTSKSNEEEADEELKSSFPNILLLELQKKSLYSITSRQLLSYNKVWRICWIFWKSAWRIEKL